MNTTYKGFEIVIGHDMDACNPFTDWDCEPCLITSHDRNTTGYNDANDYATYLPDLTWKEMRPHIAQIKEILEIKSLSEILFSWGVSDPAESIEHITAFLNDEYRGTSNGGDRFEILAKILNWSGVTALAGYGIGYRQGDWVDCIVIADAQYLERSGATITSPDQLQGSIDLYAAWAFGDTYFFNIPELEDSCGGFYGSDHETSGLLELAHAEIDNHIQKESEKRRAKLKDLIRARTPLALRDGILGQPLTSA